MSGDVPGGPTLPLRVREFATFSRSESRRLFRREPRELWRQWGVLHTVDARGVKWTALGDPEFTRALKAVERQGEPIPGYDHGVGWNRMYAVVSHDEWPIDEFRARWAIRDWPDEWPATGRLDVFPIRYPGYEVDADAFERLNADAEAGGWPSATDEAIADLDAAASIVGVRLGDMADDEAGRMVGVAWALPLKDGRTAAIVVFSPDSELANVDAVSLGVETYRTLADFGHDYLRRLGVPDARDGRS